MSELNELLNKIGFTETELKVYEVVVAFNFRTIGQISSYTKLDNTTVNQACEALVSKNYLKKIVHKSKEATVYIPLTPKIAISASVSQNLSTQLENLSSKVGTLWNDAQGHVDTDIESILTLIKEGLDKLSKSIATFKEEHSETIERANNGFQNHLRSITDKTADIFQNDINVPLSNLAEELNSLSKTIIDICDTSLQNMGEASSVHEETIIKISGQIKEELESFTDSIALFSSGRISGVTKQNEETAEKVKVEADAHISDINDQINDLLTLQKTNVAAIKSKFPKDLLADYEEKKNLVAEITDHLFLEFKKNVQATIKSNKNSIKEAILASEKMFDFIEEGQKTKLIELQTQMLKAIKSVQTEAVSNLEIILDKTIKSLNSENTTTSKNIKAYKSNLDKDLNKLKLDLIKSLTDKFLSIDTQLTQFVEDLKSNSLQNVEQITTSVTNLKEFIFEYLESVKTGLGDNLQSLENQVKGDLAKIVKDSQQELDVAVDSTIDELDKINTKFDKKTKNSQLKFQEKVSETNEMQKEQLSDLNSEADALNSDLSNAHTEINQFLEVELKEVKKSSLADLDLHVNSTMDSFGNDFSSFNENMSQQFKSFYDSFHDQSSGLREEVPERIDGLLLDQSDRLDNFRRDFQRIIGHAKDTLSKFLGSFSSNGKKIDKKLVPLLYGDVTRAMQDFQYFETQILDHFNTSIDDTDQLKSDFLNEINQIIQNELAKLQEIVTTQSGKAESITSDYLSKMKDNTSNFVNTITNGTEENISTLESNISTKMVATFQQPMNNIISKAHSLASGTEGGEKENRLLRSQNKLVKELETAVSQLHEQYKDNSSSQKKSIRKFSADVKVSLSNTNKLTLEKLNSSIDSVQSELEKIVAEKSDEISTIVQEKNQQLEISTAENTKQIDETLNTFTDEFKDILASTNKILSSTIDTSSSSQAKSVAQTITNMKKATDKTVGILETSKKSLNEDVAKPMKKVQTDVSNLIGNYDQTVAGEKMMLQSEINNFFNASSEFLDKISEQQKSFNKVKTTYLKELNIIAKKIDKNLTSYLDENITQRNKNISEFKEKLDKTINSIDDSNTGFILNVYDQVNTQLSMLQVEINENLIATKDNVDNEVTNIIETVRNDLISASEEISTTVSNEKSSIPSKLNEISETVKSLSGAQDSEFLKAKNSFLKKISDEILSRGDEWKSTNEKSYDLQISNISKLFEDFKDKIATHSGKGKDNVSQEIGKIPNVIEETLDAAAKSMQLLNQISAGSIDLDVKFPELSYFDTSEEAIMANLNGVLARTKASLTIVSPTIAWIDKDLMEKFNRVSVKIITDLTQHTPEDNKILELFKNHGINLDLRKLDKNRFRGNIDLIMATRDREEVILSKLPSSPNAYAFVTQDEIFIEKFAELFAPFQTMPRIS